MPRKDANSAIALLIDTRFSWGDLVSEMRAHLANRPTELVPPPPRLRNISRNFAAPASIWKPAASCSDRHSHENSHASPTLEICSRVRNKIGLDVALIAKPMPADAFLDWHASWTRG